MQKKSTPNLQLSEVSGCFKNLLSYDLGHHKFCEISYTAAIAPLIVIPAKKFDERAFFVAHNHRLL